jgi:hypothetical protein
MYSNNGKPKVMAAAPKLYDIELLALIWMKRMFPYGPPNSYPVVIWEFQPYQIVSRIDRLQCPRGQESPFKNNPYTWAVSYKSLIIPLSNKMVVSKYNVYLIPCSE